MRCPISVWKFNITSSPLREVRFGLSYAFWQEDMIHQELFFFGEAILRTDFLSCNAALINGNVTSS